MKPSIKKFFVGTWIIGATFSLVYFWGKHPDMFPRPPEKTSIWLTSLFDIANGEELSDFELLYMLTLSLLFVIIITLLSQYVWSRTQDMLKHKPSGRKKPHR